MPNKRIRKKPAARAMDGLQPDTRGRAVDAFANALARLGAGTTSLANGTDYVLDRVTLDYSLMLTLYRNHWLSRKIVDGPAEDMLRAWPKLVCELPPDDIKAFERTVNATGTQAKLLQTIKWARLFGGAGALLVIKGDEDRLDEPLKVDDVRPGSYRGLIPFDRWSGITPGAEVSVDLDYPRNFGLPEFYTVRTQGAKSFHVHHTRILRFTGPEVPSPEFEVQSRWGISVLEVVYDELKKRDNASYTILNLMFRAQILGLRDKELKQKLSGLGMSQKAMQAFAQELQQFNDMLSNQSLVILPGEGGMESHQYTFAGLAEVYQQFQMDIAGAAEYPITRLFGRTMTGLGQSNDGDERIYEEKIAAKQHTELKPQLDRLFPVICMSEFGEVPDDLDYEFSSVRVLTEEEKGNLAKTNSDAVIAASNSGLISQRMALKELKQASDVTGVFTNITDEDIERACDDFQPQGEVGGFSMDPLGEAGRGKPPVEDVHDLHDIVQGARIGDSDRPTEGVVELGGLLCRIENPVGSSRSGIADDGKRWRTVFHHPYGYIEGAQGADGDSLDCFIGPYRQSDNVYVIHQNKLDGSYDEDKVMLGYRTAAEARAAYDMHYDRLEAFFGSMEHLTLGQFKQRLKRRATARDCMAMLAAQLEVGGEAQRPREA